MVSKIVAAGNGQHSQISRMVDARTLLPSPENALLYRDRTVANPDFARLVESIRREDVQAPLLVSLDNYIISGHQRQRGAIESGRFLVPVIVLNISRSQHTEDGWVAVLREHNTGREKSFEELVREKLVDIDPDAAIAQIVDDEIERSRARVSSIAIGSREMKRSGISRAKREMADAILAVLRDLIDYLSISLRAIHYRLLVRIFFRNLDDQTTYKNDLKSYKDLSDMATRMRIAGEIPWDWICDETRPVTEWSCWPSASDFIAEKCGRFLKGYARDLMQSQQQHFEVVVEKLTVQNFISPIAGSYRMPLVVMRGNSGIDARYQIVKRFKESGKRSLFLFCLGDCDPDGDSIVDSTLRSIRDDFGIRRLDGTRVCMTHEQADRLDLPKTLEANTNSKNYDTFVAKHGRTDCYEMEPVDPDVSQDWLDTSIRGVIDTEAYNHEVAQQKAEVTEILARRQSVLEVMKG